MERTHKFLPKWGEHKLNKNEYVDKPVSWFQGFHLTKFRPKTIIHLAVWGTAMYAYFSVMLGAMSIVAKFSGLSVSPSTSLLISFIFAEIFPMLLLASFFSKHRHWLKDWVRYFGQDFKHKWKAVLTWSMMLFLIQVMLSILVSSLVKSNIGSENTTDLMTDLKQNGFLIVMNLIIAPICEELIFRFLLTGLVNNIFARFFTDERALTIVYWLSAAFSAFLFALLHDGLEWDNIVIYMGCALFLQAIQKRTESLTAPAMVHGLSNLFAVFVDLI